VADSKNPADPGRKSQKPKEDTSSMGATVRLPSEIDLSNTTDTLLPVAAPSKQFGKYEILGEIARGGMGIVYKARQGDLDRIVALKVLQLDDGIDRTASKQDDRQELIARFAREAQSAARLQHPNIVKIHEVGQQDGRYFFTMEYLEGGNLRDHVDKQQKAAAERGAPLSPGVAVKEVLALMRQVCEAIHYAHENGVIHRDIKPANILIDSYGVPKVTDFGLAKSADSQTHLTQSGAVMGTPSYMAPEQARGHTHEIDRRSDVFSLGAVLYEAITGRVPFDAPTVFEIIHKVAHEEAPRPTIVNHRIHRDVETIVMKALEKEKDRRYSTALELAEDIRRFLEGEPIKARPVGWAFRQWKRIRRHWVAFTACAVAVSAVGVFGTYGAIVAFQRRTEKAAQEEQEARRREAMGHLDRARRLAGQEAIDACTQAILADPDYPEAWQERGSRHAAAGKPDAGVADLTRAIGLAPDLALARLQRARIYERDLRDLSSALADYREVMRLAPREADAFVAAGRILAAQRMVGEAIETLDVAIRLAPTAANFAARAEAKLDAGRLQEARSDFSEALQRDPNDAEAHCGLGTVARLLGDPQGAEREHLLAAERNGREGRYHFELGEDRVAQKDLEGAIPHYRKAIALRPDLAKAYARLGRLYLLLGRPDEAAPYASVAMVRDPKDADAHLDLGRALSAQGHDDLAIHFFDRAIEIDPREGDAYLHRGRTLARLGRREEAIADFTTAIAKDRLCVQAYLSRARARAEEGLWKEALADTSEAERLAPDLADVHVARGVVHVKWEKWDEAIEDFSKALSKNAGHREALVERARALALRGDPKAAVADFTSAIETLGERLTEADAALFRERAAARLATGDAAGAREDLARAAGLRGALLDDPAFHVLRGRVHSALGLWEDAVEDFTEVFRLDPKPSSDLLHLRGTAYLWLEKWELAERDLRDALATDAKNAEAQAELAFLYLRQDRPEEAEKAAEAAIAIDEGDARAWYFRAAARSEMGRPKEAIEDYRKAIERSTVFPEAYQALAVLYRDEGKLPAAYEYLSHAIEQRPDYPLAYMTRGDVAEKLHRLEDAVEDYGHAIRLSPASPEAYFLRGKALFALEKLDEAIDDLSACLRRAPGEPEVLFWRGKAYRAQSRLDRALADLDEAVKQDPKNIDAYLERGRTQNDRRRYDAAINDLSVAISLAPDRADAYVDRGFANIGLGRHPEAITDFTTALSIAPKDTRALALRSRARLESGAAEDALSDAEEGLKIDAKSVPLRLARAAALEELEALDEAIAEYRQAIDLAPRDPEVRQRLAEALARAHQEREVVEQLTRAIELSPGDAELYFFRANAHFRLSMHREALADYTQALKMNPRHLQALGNRAVVHALLTEYDEAATDFERLLAVEPNHPSADVIRTQLAEAKRRARILTDGPKSPEEHFIRGDILLRRRELDASTKDFERFLAGCGDPPAEGMEEMYVQAHYNLAAYYSVRRNLDVAFDHLAKAIEGGYDDLDRLRRDPDLEELRKDPRFQEVVGPKGPGTHDPESEK